MFKKASKFIAFILVFIMSFQLLPMQVLAAELGDDEQIMETLLPDDGLSTTETSQNSGSLFEAEDVLWEDTSLREAAVKHFRMADGSYIAVDYGYDVHYLNENGEYQEIDNSLELYSEVSGEALTMEDLLTEAIESVSASRLEAQKLPGGGERLDAANSGESLQPPADPSPSLAPDNEQNSQIQLAPETENSLNAELNSSAPDADEQQTLNKTPAPELESSQNLSELQGEAQAAGGSLIKEPKKLSELSLEDILVQVGDKITFEIDDAELEAAVAEKLSECIYRNIAGDMEVSLSAVAEDSAALAMEKGGFRISLAPFTQRLSVMSLDEEPALISGKALAEINNNEIAAAPQTFEEAISASKAASSVVYPDVFPNADVEYALLGSNMKESIIVKSAGTSYAYEFTLDLEGLTPYLMDDGSIELRDENDTVSATMPIPYMYDANYESSDAVAYSLEELPGGGYKLTVTANAQWINDPARAFPVVIDPSITYPGTQYITSTYISKSYPDADISSENLLQAGYSALNEQHLFRTLLKVEVLPELPANSSIVDACISMSETWYTSVGKGTDTVLVQAMGVGEADEDGNIPDFWAGAKTWNNCPEPEPTILDYVTVGYLTNNVPVSKEWNITGEVISWYDDPAANNGLVFTSKDEAAMNNDYCAHYGFARDESSPALIVNYRSTVGLESYYTYQTIDMGRAGTGYIGDFSGALTVVKKDVYAASTVNPVTVDHVYNSSVSSCEYSQSLDTNISSIYADTKLGVGWQLSCMESIFPMRDKPGILVYKDGDGTSHYFSPKADNPGIYADEDGLGLFITGSGGAYTLYDRYGGQKQFANYMLKSFTDANGNKTAYNFNGSRLTSVTRQNTGGQSETIASLGYGWDGYLSSITDAAGRVTSFTSGIVPDGAGIRSLTNVTHADGTTADYIYHYNGRLYQATDSETGITWNYAYAPSAKVGMFTQTIGTEQGAELGVKYGSNGSYAGTQAYRYSGADRVLAAADYVQDDTSEPADDILTFCLFDYAGRTINSYTTDSTKTKMYGAASSEYTVNSGTSPKNNRLLSSTVIGVTAVNLIQDGGIENSTALTGITDTAGYWHSSTRSPLGWLNKKCASIVNTNAHTGLQSLKLESSGVQTVEASQNLTGLTPDGYYTASAYVNTSELTVGGACISAGSWGSTLVNWKTDVKIEEWVKISFTFQADSNGKATLTAKGAAFTGSIYFDDFQVEPINLAESLQNSEALAMPSEVNLVQNGDFTYASANWYSSDVGAETPAPAVTDTDQVFGTVLRLDGDVGADVKAHQVININLPSSETFAVSAYSRANSVPLSEDNEERAWGIRALVYYAEEEGKDNLAPEEHEISFCPDIDKWQFVMLPVVPKVADRTVEKIAVELVYDHNANSAYFSRVSLVREPSRSYKYNDDGDLISVSTPGNAEQSFTYSGADLTKQITRGSGEYDYAYDNKHNLTSMSNDGVTMNVYYDGSTDTTVGAGNTTATKLTAAGTSEYISSSSTYAGNGNLLASTTDARGKTATYAYGSALSRMLGAPTAATDANGTTRGTVYNENNGRTTGSFITDTVSLAYAYQDGRIVEMARNGYAPASSVVETQSYVMSYDSFGNLTSVTVKGDSETSEGRALASYAYAPNNGLLQSMTYGNGTVVNYVYDSLERVVGIRYNNSITDGRNYFYNGEGDVSSVYDGLSGRSYSYEYDSLGRLTSVLQSQGVTLLHSWNKYDDANRVSEQHYRLNPSAASISGAVNTVFDNARVTKYTYDEADGKLTSMSAPGGNLESQNVTLSYSYDELKRLVGRTLTLSGGTDPLVAKSYTYVAGAGTGATTTMVESVSTAVGGRDYNYSYTYDNVGNITEVVGKTNSTYVYDSQNQLTGEVTGSNVYQYTYDTYGNIRSKEATSNGGTTTHTYSYEDPDWLDLLTTYDGTPITYDGAGNPLSYRGMTFTWANGKQLTQSVKSGTATDYTYETGGLRTTKTTEKTSLTSTTHIYIWSEGRLVSDCWGTVSNGLIGKLTKDLGINLLLNPSMLEFMYDESGNPYGFLYKAGGASTYAAYYYVTNLQGDIVAIVDKDGNEVASYTYNAYGEIISQSGAMADINPLRYRGYYYDAETGLYYLQSRYYDATTGRFINADDYASTGQDFSGCNMFAYCGNNPTNFCDPSGDYRMIDGWNPNDYTSGGSAINILAMTFGASVSAVSLYETPDFPEAVSLLPVSLNGGARIYETFSEIGDSSKPISVYAIERIDNPMASAAGIKINGAFLTIKINFAADDTGIYFIARSGETSSSLGLRIDWTHVKIGIESEYTNQNNGIVQVSDFANLSVSGLLLFYLYVVSSGGALQPQYA